jgi:non-canonical purine NTP pyrophosphatase (RdgB/HAM1 family)
MTLYFITGNKNKFAEAKAILPKLEQLVMDLTEIQETDAHKIIEYKLKEAMKHQQGEFVVEDTSLHMDCLNGLPGPFIKWFLQDLGVLKIAEIAHNMGNKNATYTVLIGYARNAEIQFFEGSIRGTIEIPRGEKGFGGFGFDPIFQAQGETRTYGEMTREEKLRNSARSRAFTKLKEYLLKRS